MRWLFLLFIWLLVVGLPVAAQTDTIVYATAQPFENGLMIWRADTSHIWALANDGRVFEFPASTYASLTDNPIFGNPASRLRPIHGMGKVWGHYPAVRTALGWPTLPELGFDMPVRTTDGVTYLTQLDTTVIEIRANHTWNRSVDTTIPFIHHFGATPDSAVAGAAVTLHWRVQGTDEVLIEVHYPVRGSNAPQLIEHLPLTGSTTLTIPDHYINGVRFVLWGVNRGPAYNPVHMVARIIHQTLAIPVVARPDQITTPAVFQQYEQGFLIWRADTGAVLAFGGEPGGQFMTFPESRYATWPDSAPYFLPANHLRPINAFGIVWGNVAAVRQMIGLPTGTEQAFTLTVSNGASSDTPLEYTLPTGEIAAVHQQRFWEFGN